MQKGQILDSCALIYIKYTHKMEPTHYGFVDSTHDALLIFEAVKQRQLDRITRRLQEKERCHISSGSIFVFDEVESRIKRWTDGRMWSPSRILGNFCELSSSKEESRLIASW